MTTLHPSLHNVDRSDEKSLHELRFNLKIVKGTILIAIKTFGHRFSGIGLLLIILVQVCRAFAAYSSIQSCSMNRTCHNAMRDYDASYILANQVFTF
jgi:hypothetical protein